MKSIFILLTSFTLLTTSCQTEKSVEQKDEVKSIINDSYYGIHLLRKMSELNIIQDDIFSLPIHYSMLDGYIDVTPDHKYHITRYIYKTNDGVYRIFFIIDLTDERVVEKNSEYSAFFEPLTKKILGDNAVNMEGNNTVEIMKY